MYLPTTSPSYSNGQRSVHQIRHIPPSNGWYRQSLHPSYRDIRYHPSAHDVPLPEYTPDASVHPDISPEAPHRIRHGSSWSGILHPSVYPACPKSPHWSSAYQCHASWMLSIPSPHIHHQIQTLSPIPAYRRQLAWYALRWTSIYSHWSRRTRR